RSTAARLKQRLPTAGVRGLVHQGRGRPSPRGAEALRQQVGQLLQTTFAGFSDCHLTEKLRERERPPGQSGIPAARAGGAGPGRPPAAPAVSASAAWGAGGRRRRIGEIDGGTFAWLKAAQRSPRRSHRKE